MSKAALSKYVPTNQDVFLFDTNILIHLFYPVMSSHSDMGSYVRFFQKALNAKSSLILTAIQLSEFINRCIRFQFDLYKNSLDTNQGSFNFKQDYRGTEDYRECMNAILDIVKNDILSSFSLVNDRFESINPNSLLLYGFSYDFNDALLVQIAEQHNASIVTHDRDFANYATKQKIISSNPMLLMFS